MRSVIVIGAGMAGTSTAFRLATAGASVTVVDKAQPGNGTTANSFAWVNANQKTPREYFDLNFAGMKEHDRLDAELGGARWLHRTGNLDWTGDPVRYDELCRRVERLQSWGYNAQWLTAGDVNRDLEPHIAFSGPSMRVAWFPDEAWVNGPEYVRDLLDRAVKAGATVRTGEMVVGIDALQNGVTVRLSDGQELSADAVVNCAGPQADHIASLVGRTLPLEPTRGLLMRMEVEQGSLSRIIHGTDVNIRPDEEGYVLIHHESIDYLIRDNPDVAVDDKVCRELCRRAKRVFPSITGRRITETRLGVRPYPVDHVSCIGSVSGIPGYYEAVTHSAVTLGPLLGRLVAEEILEGKVDPITTPFRADRFS